MAEAMTADPEVLRQLARDSAERLTELGVRAGDSRWIRTHAETIASLAERSYRAVATKRMIRTLEERRT